MKILIAYDGSTHADAAIDGLRRAGLPPVAEALVVSAVDDWKLRLGGAENAAEVASIRVQKYFPKWDVRLETVADSPAAAILHRAHAWPADLIVAGTHGRSAIGRAVLGSVSMKLVKQAPCSVRVVRPSTHNGAIRLLIGDDGSYEAENVVTEVCLRSWPAGTEARVLAVHDVLVPVSAERVVLDDEFYEQINEDERFRLRHLASQAEEKLHAAGLVASSVVEDGDAKETLVEKARSWDADTIFIGARGLGRVERFLLGSVSSATVAQAPCTVEIVRHR